MSDSSLITSTSDGGGGGSGGEDFLHNIPISDTVPVEDTTDITTTTTTDDNTTDNVLGETKTKTVVVEEPDGGFSPRAKSIAMTSKVTGGMSMICSAYLIYYILIRGGHIGGGGRTRNNTRRRRNRHEKQTGDELNTSSSPSCCFWLGIRREQQQQQQQVQEHHHQSPTTPSTPGRRWSSSLKLLSDLSLTNRPTMNKKTTTYQRLIVMLCVCDFIASFGYFLSTWPLPEGNNFGAAYDYGYDVASLVVDDGGEGTGGLVTFSNPLCTAQGVFLHWGLTTALCNVVLSTHYILVVRYKFTERALRKAEPYYMSAIVLIGLIFISIPLALGTYGFNPYSRNIWCFIFVPCEDKDEAECIRRTVILRWALYFGPLWLCIIVCTVLMTTLYVTVRGIETSSRKWTLAASIRRSMYQANQRSLNELDNSDRLSASERSQRPEPVQLKTTKQVARQAIMYVGVFIIVWLPLLVLNTLNLVRQTWFDPEQVNGFLALWFVMLLQPLQGVFNLIVYKRFGVVKVVSNRVSKFSRYISNRISSSVNSRSSVRDSCASNELSGVERLHHISSLSASGFSMELVAVKDASPSKLSTSPPSSSQNSVGSENDNIKKKRHIDDDLDGHPTMDVDENEKAGDGIPDGGDECETLSNIKQYQEGKSVRFSMIAQEEGRGAVPLHDVPEDTGPPLERNTVIEALAAASSSTSNASSKQDDGSTIRDLTSIYGEYKFESDDDEGDDNQRHVFKLMDYWNKPREG